MQININFLASLPHMSPKATFFFTIQVQSSLNNLKSWNFNNVVHAQLSRGLISAKKSAN